MFDLSTIILILEYRTNG